MSVRPFNVRLAFVAALLWMFFAAPAFAQYARGGAQVYLQVCAACHARGIAGAPRFGDRQAWRPRLESGQPALTAQAWVGVRAMPPRGGRDDLGLAEFARGAAYMARAAGAKWRDPDLNMLTAIQDAEKNRRSVIGAN